jgi:anti-sigma regulatory factor (Ser/Thr protein kinase)
VDINGRQRPVVLSRDGVTRSGLDPLRRLVTETSRQAGLSADRAAHLTTAVNEILSNAILHAGGNGDVAISRSDDCLVVEVSDRGTGIPASVSVARPGPEALGGRGLWLAHMLCDQVDISTGADGTRIRLVMLAEPSTDPWQEAVGGHGYRRVED